MEEKNLVPSPFIVESMRFLGYSFESAVADIIDNSIAAGADCIQLEFSSREPRYLCIIDNGQGMDENELETAMRYGSRNPLEQRDRKDLGRFGLGLKTASSSQCRKLTVLTRRNGQLSAACWDLDYIVHSGQWTLKSWSDDEAKKTPAI